MKQSTNSKAPMGHSPEAMEAMRTRRWVESNARTVVENALAACSDNVSEAIDYLTEDAPSNLLPHFDHAEKIIKRAVTMLKAVQQ